MKKFTLLSLILSLSIFLPGCSYGYDFIIANVSDGVLEIELKWKENLYSTPYKFKFETFDGKTFEKLEAIDGFTKEEIEAAEEKNSFKISLEPKQALRIHTMINEERDDNKLNESFHINYLNLKGKRGIIEMTNEQIWFQFRKINQDYFIIYK